MSENPTPSRSRFSLDDYVDVAERIADFIAKYPEGTLQTVDWEVREVGERTFIVYRAAAYRTPDDQRPGMGIAWEPFPGKTPYTRDSELMNAETSAWGRAIVACGLSSRKIASRQEVLARQGNDGDGAQAPRPVAAAPGNGGRKASEQERKMILDRAREAELDPEAFANVILFAVGQPAREFEGPDAADRWNKRQLDRLPASRVDDVLAGIAGQS